VAAQNKDNEIRRLQAEAERKLLELNCLAQDKNNEIQRNAEEIERLRAEAANTEEKIRFLKGNITEIKSSAKKEINEIQLNVEDMQFAARNKDNEIGRLRAEAVNAKESV
jgi:peptidoglycan hydrolase CwlO-like protein